MSKFFIHGTNTPIVRCRACGVRAKPVAGIRTSCPGCGTIDDECWPHTPKPNEECCIPAGIEFKAREEGNSDFKLRLAETIWVDAIEWCDKPYVVIGGDSTIFGDEQNYCIYLADWDRRWEYSHAFPTVATLPAANPASTKSKSAADVATA